MQIKLHRPLVFLDIEATGLSIGSDRIVEIALLRVNVDQTTDALTRRFNPGIPIPPEVTKIHGITDEDVKDSPSFSQGGHEIMKFIGTGDLAGYNSNKYDIPLLAEEFLRAGIDFDIESRKLVDVQNIFHFMEPRTLHAAYKFYCNADLNNAHQAMADVKATYEVFKAQLVKYEHTQLLDEKGQPWYPVVNDIPKLSALSTRTRNVDLAGRVILNEKGEEVFSFGKHKDKKVTDVFEKEPSYYTWMMNGDFPLQTKKVLTRIRLSMKQ